MCEYNESIKEQFGIINRQIKELSFVYRDAAAKFGISDNEFWVWYAMLISEDEFSQQDICDMWSLPKQTVNTIVSNLSRRGYVFLETDPEARNRKLIRITEKGREYGKEVMSGVYRAEQQVLSSLTEKERQTCIELLGKYIKLLKEEVYE